MNYNQLVNNIIEAKTKEYPNRQFYFKNLLGSSVEGGVFIASSQNWGDNSKQVAFKIRKLMTENEKNFISRLIHTKKTYEKSNDLNYLPTNIIQIYEYFEWKQHHCTVMEVGQENLLDCINQNKNGSIKERERICFQITLPILFLHNSNFTHRDIRPENFIKVGNVFKLIDFGLIRGSNPNELKTMQFGTLIYQAPEIIQCSNKYTEKIDIWSLACVFYEILTASQLFDGQTSQQVQQQILNHEVNPNNVNNKISQLNTSKTIKELLTNMLAFEESKRPTIQQIYTKFQQYLNNNDAIIDPLQDNIISAPILDFLIGNLRLQDKLNKGEKKLYIQPNRLIGESMTQNNLHCHISFIDTLISYQNQNDNQVKEAQQIKKPSGFITIFDKFQWANYVVIVTEVGEQDLLQYLNQSQLSMKQKLKILIQISQSIQYLHNSNLIHKDIKPQNFIKVSDQFNLLIMGW